MKLARYGWAILPAAIFAAGLGGQTSDAAPVARQSSQQAQQSKQSESAKPAPAQSSHNNGDALDQAARRAREKQKDEGKPAKVWDNDNLPTAGDVNVIGSSAQGASPEGANNAADESSTGPAAPSPNYSETTDQSELEAQLKSAKADLKQLQSQLDFAQRKFALDEQNFYQNPNYNSDKAGAEVLKSEQNQINAQKQRIDATKKKVDEINAKIGPAKSVGGAQKTAADRNGSAGEENSNRASSQ